MSHQHLFESTGRTAAILLIPVLVETAFTNPEVIGIGTVDSIRICSQSFSSILLDKKGGCLEEFVVLEQWKQLVSVCPNIIPRQIRASGCDS